MRPRTSYLALLALTCMTSGAWGQVTLTVANAGAYANMGGVYTSPYGLQIDGGSPTLMICDDFLTDIYVGYSWQANVTTLSSLSSSTVAGLKFANSPYGTSPGILGGVSNAAQDYAVAAVLAAELMSLPNIGTAAENQQTAGQLSYAIWGVFDAPLLTSTNTGYGTLTTTDLNAAKADITSAQALVAAATIGGVTDLTKISINGNPITGLTVYTAEPNAGASQEFLRVSMPEPSSPASLAIDLLAVFGLVMVLRRRTVGISK